MRIGALLTMLGAMVLGSVDWHSTQGAKASIANGSEWADLMPGVDLAGWKRVGLDPEFKVGTKNPWKMDTKKKVLHCDGIGVKEMLLYENELSDGILHVEWRFQKVEGKDTGYNSGVYVRSKDDGKVWLQAQVAMLDKTPQVGDLFGDVPDAGKYKRVLVAGSGHQHVKPVGEWNAFDIHCEGKNITVKLNGKHASVMRDWIREDGFLGLQAEFFVIEFKNIKWKSSKS